ncbi:uncharacterized protein LOC18447686 [Amborella trichopoda]|uniref:3'-5' exonuclease domain-containing protein n=1 Tax=Amborella trichopoda TaxID=13333 RepID=U5DFV3_AMBTC|nr:uncharacterized protein LOC18447686 [Amborella trichopoda]ERN19308.1 hypothetical protein AMTR_s00069p00051250 [Amborella trichopoda]|eukprot:XP_006857841.1 uncharacterized protein LOC18447686 [Amborella trichopoda]
MDSNQVSSQNCFQVPNQETHFISSPDSSEFFLFIWALNHSSIVGLDSEWKPSQTQNSHNFPKLSILQIACKLTSFSEFPLEDDNSRETDKSNCLVFILDLFSLPPSSIWKPLRDLFISPNVLKLGFKFKQDLIYLSSSLTSQGSEYWFDKVEPYMDIANIYHLLRKNHGGKVRAKESKSLATICEDLLGVHLSKELQCSDWACRPLGEDQISYAAADAQCLLEIFNMFQSKLRYEGLICLESHPSTSIRGLKEILIKKDLGQNVLMHPFCQAVDMIKSIYLQPVVQSVMATNSFSLHCNTPVSSDSLSEIVKRYGETISLKVCDRFPKPSGRKARRRRGVKKCEEEWMENFCDWQGPAPWDSSAGNDGCPKFLCDVMVEGLAKQLRSVGIDAAVPFSKRPEPRQLIDQAIKEKRVLLTRDTKLLRRQYLSRNQMYRVKNLAKDDQLLEVIEAFDLKISEDQLLSRCIKCNGRFIPRPLTGSEAVAAAKGMQAIPECLLLQQDYEFWQCADCNQIYWEGVQYHNAMQKFITICKLNE